MTLSVRNHRLSDPYGAGDLHGYRPPSSGSKPPLRITLIPATKKTTQGPGQGFTPAESEKAAKLESRSNDIYAACLEMNTWGKRPGFNKHCTHRERHPYTFNVSASYPFTAAMDERYPHFNPDVFLKRGFRAFNTLNTHFINGDEHAAKEFLATVSEANKKALLHLAVCDFFARPKEDKENAPLIFILWIMDISSKEIGHCLAEKLTIVCQDASRYNHQTRLLYPALIKKVLLDSDDEMI